MTSKVKTLYAQNRSKLSHLPPRVGLTWAFVRMKEEEIFHFKDFSF